MMKNATKRHKNHTKIIKNAHQSSLRYDSAGKKR